MLIKFFGNKGGGSPKASMDYLLREGKEDTQFQVLRGDPELSQSIAESCGFMIAKIEYPPFIHAQQVFAFISSLAFKN